MNTSRTGRRPAWLAAQKTFDVAGDRVRERMLRSGLSMRLTALFFVAAGLYVGRQTITTGISLDAVVILYVATALTVVVVVRRYRRSA